jgi:hypothetical protein
MSKAKSASKPVSRKETPSGGKGAYLSVRCPSDDKETYTKAARRLRVDLTDLVTMSLAPVAGKIQTEGWECRSLYLSLDGTSIIGMGSDPPSENGIPIPSMEFEIVAPAAFWSLLEERIYRA